MREGLRKGTLTMKNNAKKTPFVCPICGETFYYQKSVAEKKKFCSLQCAGKSGAWEKGILNGAKISHERNVERKKRIKNDITHWVLNNKNIISNCPYNRITPTLFGLIELLETKYNIKDLRSIFICFDVKNKKELLDKLKEIIYISKENVC